MSAYILRNGSAAAILKKCLPRQLNNNNFAKVISSKSTTTKLIKFNKWFQFVRKEGTKNIKLYYILHNCVQLFLFYYSLTCGEQEQQRSKKNQRKIWQFAKSYTQFVATQSTNTHYKSQVYELSFCLVFFHSYGGGGYRIAKQNSDKITIHNPVHMVGWSFEKLKTCVLIRVCHRLALL